MTQIFNKTQEREKRKILRHQIPEAEVIMWSQLLRSRLNGFKFRRQCGIGRYVVDFYCPKARLIVEIDGPTHFTDEVEQYDKDRETYFEALGLNIIRFTNTEVRKQLPVVLDALLNKLNQLVSTNHPVPPRRATPPS